MTDSRVEARWFFAAMLGLPFVEYVFSFAGAYLLTAMLPDRPKQAVFGTVMTSAFAWWWLGAGLLVALLGFAACVGYSGAPVRLWYVALALSLIRVGSLAATVVTYWLLVPASDSGVLRATVNSAATVQSGSTPHFLVAVVGYVLAAVAGCLFGARLARRRVQTASSGESSLA